MGTIYYFDSLDKVGSKSRHSDVKAHLQLSRPKGKGRIYEIGDVRPMSNYSGRQHDSTSCGVFIVLMAEHILTEFGDASHGLSRGFLKNN